MTIRADGADLSAGSLSLSGATAERSFHITTGCAVAFRQAGDLIMIFASLKERGTGLTLSSAHLGSMGGMPSATAGPPGRGSFDPRGGYNSPTSGVCCRGGSLPGQPCLPMQGDRAAGNPDQVSDINPRRRSCFVSRQKGAGTASLITNSGGLDPAECSTNAKSIHPAWPPPWPPDRPGWLGSCRQPAPKTRLCAVVRRALRPADERTYRSRRERLF